MITHSVYIGADVSKDSIELGCPSFALPASIPNTPAGFRRLLKILSKSPSPIHVVCEATGPYHKAFVAALHHAQMVVSVVNPRQARDFARARGKLAKTDSIDALALADYGQTMKPQPTPCPEPEITRLDELVTRRDQLIGDRARERTRIQQTTVAEIISSLKLHLRHLDTQFEKITACITKLVQSHSTLKEKVTRMTQVQGVGTTTAAALLAAMPELGTLSKTEAAALAGLAPYNHDSGAFRGKRTIHGGRLSARQALYMSALVASHANPILKTFYQRLLSNGKAHKVALTAVMRKLLIHLNSLLKSPIPVAA